MTRNPTPKTPPAFPLMLLFIALLAPHAAAQGASDVDNTTGSGTAQAAVVEPYHLEEGMNEWGVWAGGSFDSPTLIGTAEERKYFTVGLRYGRIFAASKRVAYEYTADVVPVAVVFQPEFARAVSRSRDSSVYGAGLAPFGLKVNFNRGGRLKPFAGGSAGFLYFTRPVPIDVPGATRFNFTFDFGGGVQIFTQARRAVTLGYKFHHISNAGTSQVNPGLDANVFYVGYSFFK